MLTQKQTGYNYILLLAQRLQILAEKERLTPGRLRMILSLLHHLYYHGRALLPMTKERSPQHEEIQEALKRAKGIVSLISGS